MLDHTDRVELSNQSFATPPIVLRPTNPHKKEVWYGHRTEGCSYHRCVAGHRRGPRQGVPRSQLPGGRDGALNQAVERCRRPRRAPATSPIGRRPNVRSPRAWPGSGGSTRSSTTPASSSPSRSPSTPRPTTRRSWASTSPASSTSRNSPSPRWRSKAAAMSCRSRRAWSITRSPAYRPCSPR